MNLQVIKIVLWTVFILLTASLTIAGLKSDEAEIDFKSLSKEKVVASKSQEEDEFKKIIELFPAKVKTIKPDIFESTDTSRLALAVILLDTMQQYLYAGVLAERLANISNKPGDYHRAGRYYLSSAMDENLPLLKYRKATQVLEKCVELQESNLDAKVDLAVSIYNLNLYDKPEDQMKLMRPIQLLLGVEKADPEHLDAQYFLAKLAVESEQLEKAIVRYKKLVSLQPENPEYYSELIGIYKRLGDEKEVKIWEEKARKIFNKQ